MQSHVRDGNSADILFREPGVADRIRLEVSMVQVSPGTCRTGPDRSGLLFIGKNR